MTGNQGRGKNFDVISISHLTVNIKLSMFGIINIKTNYFSKNINLQNCKVFNILSLTIIFNFLNIKFFNYTTQQKLN